MITFCVSSRSHPSYRPNTSTDPFRSILARTRALRLDCVRPLISSEWLDLQLISFSAFTALFRMVPRSHKEEIIQIIQQELPLMEEELPLPFRTRRVQTLEDRVAVEEEEIARRARAREAERRKRNQEIQGRAQQEEERDLREFFSQEFW